MDQMELHYSSRSSTGDGDPVLQLLESIRMRYEDPAVCRVGYLCLPWSLVNNKPVQVQDELERYVPSLVLS